MYLKKRYYLGIIVTFILGVILGANLGRENNRVSDTKSDENTMLLKTESYEDGKASGIQWLINSGEAKALRYQTYNIATERIKQLAKEHEGEENLAVILDIDETVLNNYYYLAKKFLDYDDFKDMSFSEWFREESSTLIEGAKSFLNTANELGIKIFYVTNRSYEVEEESINNLLKFNLPYADEEHVLTANETSDKIFRIDSIRENHNVLMYLGDNLGDFPEEFYHKSNEERSEIVDNIYDKFGTQYFILPNTIYGDWDKAIYDYDNSKSDEELIRLRIEAIDNYCNKAKIEN